MGKRQKQKRQLDEAHVLDQQSEFKQIIIAKNEDQEEMLRTIDDNIITFVKGVPGSGKTYMAIYYALHQIFKKQYENIVFSRPVVEAAGENLGFLPGNIASKIDPYMVPIFDALSQMLPTDVIKSLMNKNGHDPIIKILPLAYMRGITHRNSIVVLDEAQNMTAGQMRMLLTRIGENTKMIICGDILQSDIKVKNGLEDAFERLQDIDGISFVTLTDSLPRHPLIAKIEERYQMKYN